MTSKEWKKCKLGEIAEFNPSESIKKGQLAKKIAMEKLIPYCKQIPSFERCKYNGGTKFRNGDTIMARITPCLENGKISKVTILNDNEIGFGSTEYIVFRAIENLSNPDFLYYLITSSLVREPAIKSMVGSSGRQRVQIDVVKNIEIGIPPLETQQKIASILSSIDDKIELNNSINNNLEQQAQCYFDEIISRNKNMKYSEIGNICNVKGGKRLPKGVNLITTPNNHPYIRVRDLNSICVAQLNNEYEYVDDETQKSISRYIVNSNDIIISIVGTIGLTAIIGKTLNKANLTENCVKLTNLTHVTPEFLLLFLRSKIGQELIKKSTVGAVQAKLPIKNIQAIKVPIFYDIGFNNYLKLVFTNISNNILENQSLIHIRDSLLPKLMSGEIDVSEVDISADKLLFSEDINND